MELETKTVEHTVEIKQAFEDFLGGFEAFKQANDERLKRLERRSADVLSEEKVARIDTALTETKQKLDTLMLAQTRPQLGGERKAFDPALMQRKQAFDRYVRKGDGPGLQINDIEVKAMSEGSNPDGGYTVPLEIERTIDRVLSQASPIRAIS
ncbi:MAG TPA: phage major capsid protein, partial [Rhizomicrobium sp.]|nr:phage major capsid protein [Rhizomicrobium sp.]